MGKFISRPFAPREALALIIFWCHLIGKQRGWKLFGELLFIILLLFFSGITDFLAKNNNCVWNGFGIFVFLWLFSTPDEKLWSYTGSILYVCYIFRLKSKQSVINWFKKFEYIYLFIYLYSLAFKVQKNWMQITKVKYCIVWINISVS